MKFHILKYFAKPNEGKGICADDFKNKDKLVKINLNFVISLSEPEKFELPFSGRRTDNVYSVLTMSNNDKYYIREEVFKEISRNI